MFIFLLLIFGNLALQMAADQDLGESSAYVVPLGPNNGENPIEEAIKLLQLGNIKNLKKEVDTLQQENEMKDKEIILLEEKYKNSLKTIEQMKVDQKEEVKKIKEENEEQMNEIKKVNSENEIKYENR